MAVKTKNFWVLLLCMLGGLTVGNFVGDLAKNISFLSFIQYGQSFGLDSPVNIDLGVLVMSVQFTIEITLAGILGMVTGVLLYKKI
ncbi:MAG: DUF4321 domain-containing protein [Cellulosilyticaceae bacterium]